MLSRAKKTHLLFWLEDPRLKDFSEQVNHALDSIWILYGFSRDSVQIIEILRHSRIRTTRVYSDPFYQVSKYLYREDRCS